MTNRASWLALAVAFLASAGCSEKKSTDSSKATPANEPKADPTETRADTAATEPPPAIDAGPTPLELADEIYPQKDLVSFINVATFLGWSRDDTRYAVEVWRGRATGLSNNRAAALIEVYDARTERLVALFQKLENFEDADKKANIRKSWARARPEKEWKAYAEEHGIAVGDSALPDGWKARIRAAGKLAKMGKLEAKKGKLKALGDKGLNVEWDFFADAEDFEMFRAQMGSDNPEDTYDTQPTLKLSFKSGDATWSALWMKIPYTANDLDAAPAVEGEVAFYPSNHGNRVAIVARWNPIGMNREMSVDVTGAFYSRALGPQVEVVGTKDSAAQMAARIEKMGHPVTSIETDGKPDAKRSVSYRGKAAKPVAEAIAEKLGVEVEELKKSGWLHIIVNAGAP